MPIRGLWGRSPRTGAAKPADGCRETRGRASQNPRIGIIGGAVLDIYSSGLSLLTLGLRTPRYVAAAIDGVLMIIGTIYIVWFATDFIGPFQGFLITLAVPVAAWCGIFVADVALRRQDFDAVALYDPRGRYGSVNVTTVLLMVVGTAIGWGLVTNSFASWLTWQGYLMGPIGGKQGDWAFANLGVVAAIVIGFVGYYLMARGSVRTQESAAPVHDL